MGVQVKENRNSVAEQNLDTSVCSNETIDVLLVEDEPLYASLIMRRMKDVQDPDLRVVLVETLADALEHISAGTTDVVLLDLMLPDSSGKDTLSRMRESAPDVPIVVLTGHQPGEMAMEAIQLGAEDYLTKGADEKLLVRSIRYSVERSRSRNALYQSRVILRSAQSQLMQIEKMDSIGRLAAGIAHEVRNPLAILQMGIGYIRKYSGKNSDDVVSTLEDMDEAVTRSLEIINGLLEFCVPTELNLKRISLNSCICQIMSMVRHEIQKKHIDFHHDLCGELPDLLLDRNKIKQVLLNLLLNALDAMSEGGDLVVSTYACPLKDLDFPTSDDFASEQPKEARVVVAEIKDTGPGIPDSAQPHIFDPFYTTKPVGSATGLGLSITRNIIEQHGGRINIANRSAQGVRASILFVA